MAGEISEEEKLRIKSMIDDLVSKAKVASEEYLKLDQETVDNVIKAMSMAGLDNHMKLAKMAVEETGRGIYEDKITKNMFATEYIYHNIKYGKTVGVISENEEEGYEEIAEPIGIIAGVTPVTNPTSTTMFKSIIAAKTRNVIIFGFHPSAQKCSVEAARILRDAAIAAGAPENCILWIEEPSIEKTKDILLQLKPIYEEYHNVIINNEIINQIINLTEKYIYNRYRPDKQIDILDEVCSKVNIKGNSKNIEKESLLKEIQNKKETYIKEKNIKKAYEYKIKELQT